MAVSSYRFIRVRSIVACAAAVLLVAPVAAPAQGWKPQQQVEIIIGSAAGSSPDSMARYIQKIWQEKRLVEVPTNVVNRVGGGNTIAWNFLNQRPGDGHFLMALPFVCPGGSMSRMPGRRALPATKFVD